MNDTPSPIGRKTVKRPRKKINVIRKIFIFCLKIEAR